MQNGFSSSCDNFLCVGITCRIDVSSSCDNFLCEGITCRMDVSSSCDDFLCVGITCGIDVSSSCDNFLCEGITCRMDVSSSCDDFLCEDITCGMAFCKISIYSHLLVFVFCTDNFETFFVGLVIYRIEGYYPCVFIDVIITSHILFIFIQY